MRIRLRDVDNRDEDQRPYAALLSLEQAIGYLDGPLRRDLVGDADGGPQQRLNLAIERLRSGDVAGAHAITRRLGVSLEVAP